MVEQRGACRFPGGVVCACLAALACGSAGGDANPGRAYLNDPAFARAELVASLVNPGNGYSAIRLAHYATGADGDWDRLPEWNPPAEPIQAAELDAPGGASTTELSPAAAPLALPASVTSEDDPALVALGEAAFARYPAQVGTYFSVALASRAAASRFGLWVDEARGVGGLVRARMADGSGAVALTCSSCHARPDADGVVAPGLPNAALDVGAAILAAEGVPAALSDDPIAAWGPGRVDVTTATGVEPARIPDLRPVRWLTHLQQDATVRARDLTALAIRIETLVVMSNEAVLRPPRVIALALAAYLRSLGDGLPAADAGARASARGGGVFAATCARCHGSPGLTGAPVPLAVVGTDPTLGLSADRGTGFYRVPSLRGVGTRGPLLHDGTIRSVSAMLDPARVTDAFTERLHGQGAVPGHPFGLDLSDDDRQALIAYLSAL
jgi:cytochrome c5